MAIYTPRGLRISLPAPYAFALMQRLYPTVDAFKVLKTTEGLQSVPSMLTFLSGLVCFYLRLSPYHVCICVFSASVAGTVLTLFGVIVPGLPRMATIYSYISGLGLLFGILVFYGFWVVGWRAVLGFGIGSVAAGIVSWFLQFWNAKKIYAKTGQRLLLPELNFLNAYRLHASVTIASPPISYEEFKKRIDVSISQEEMKGENWKECFNDLAVKWPAVVRRFTETDLRPSEHGDSRLAVGTLERILVSHEEAVNEVIEEILSSSGYEVKTTTHPSEVLGLVREFAPDLVLIKLVAPEVNGLDLSEQLVVRFPKVKIVIVGPFCDLKWTETYLQDRGIGCKFLDAPFSRNELLDVVESQETGRLTQVAESGGGPPIRERSS